MLRSLLIITGLAVCGVTLTLTLVQQRQLGSLKNQERELRAQTTEALPAIAETTAAKVIASQTEQHTPSLELLRLRGQVGQLERRQRELAGVRRENETLRAQLATKGTNAPGGIPLPAGYLRKADAKFSGYSTPEATIQTMLWAVQNQSTDSLLQVFSPEYAREVAAEIQKAGSAEDFFKGAEAIPGLHVLGKPEATATEGEVVLQVEVVPGQSSEQLRFKLVAGQWKLVSGF